MKYRVLVVDDQEPLRDVIRMMLESGGYETVEVADAAALQVAFGGPPPDAVLLDLKLPDADGLDLLPLIKRQWPGSEVIVLTGHASFETAVEAIKRGAFHFQQKPIDPKGLLNLLSKALERKSLKEEANALRATVSALSGGTVPVFNSPAMKKVLTLLERVAPSDAAILVTGESGSGKEIIADLIHALSGRKGQCVKINCAALPKDLIESELFGHKKGAFTDAKTDKTGLFREANGGTLLLDELAEMPIETQSKLLRVLQDKKVRPVGDSVDFPVNCRIVASTNRKIDEAIRTGKLREDLYYRIGVVSVALPPLRERREDILPLANSFLHRFAKEENRPATGFTPAAQDRLQAFDWPGNIRQLVNEIYRAVLIADDALVDVEHLNLPQFSQGVEADVPGLTLMEKTERAKIIEVLEQTGGNKFKTAKLLGIGRQTLYNKLRAYQIAA
ncbi:MAG: sigma-54-dependent Fis family transcriptional regulator [Verrucomicrobia bacterium]|nr:sigma-54-dependent Fis family transcriptional regulator [Verrucomicrobiota bacterium]